MKGEAMKYNFGAGELQISDDFNDKTMHMLLAPSIGMTFLIGRDELEAGENLQQFFDRQLVDLKRQVAKFEILHNGEIIVENGENKFIGHDLSFKYKQRGMFSYQRQAMFLLQGKTVISFTASTTEPMSDVQVKKWRDAVMSSKFF